MFKTFSVSTFQKLRAKDLPCLFAELVAKYNEVGLKTCETKESQKWRHASNQETAKHLTLYHNYIPELSNLHSVLESYSICEKHYNQIIVADYFYRHIAGFVQENKRLRLNTDEADVTDNINPSVELEKTRKLLESSQLENQQKLRLIADLSQQVEDQRKEIVDLKALLQKAYDDIVKIRNMYEEQRKDKEILMKQWASRHCDQHKRIQAVIDMNENLCIRISSL